MLTYKENHRLTVSQWNKEISN